MSPAPAVRPRVCALAAVPVSVAPKEMSSPAAKPVVIKTLLVNVTPVANAIPSFVLAMFPPIELRPAPSCLNSFPTDRFAPFAVVNRPALATSIVVPTTLLPTPFIVRLFPVKSNWLVRSTRPVKVVATVPASCVKLAAVNVLEAKTVAPEVTVTSPRRETKPTAPVKVMSPPVPATRVSA